MATPEPTNREKIFAAILGLHNHGQKISRQVLIKLTGLKHEIVSDHVERAVEHGRLRRISNGVFELVEVFPPNRAISKTVLPDGTVILEVGDEVLKLTPSEAQVLGGNLIGEATVYSQLRGDRDVSDKVARLERQREDDRQRIERLTKEVAKMNRQAELAFE